MECVIYPDISSAIDAQYSEVIQIEHHTNHNANTYERISPKVTDSKLYRFTRQNVDKSLPRQK